MMDIQVVSRFFLWCTIINGGMLILAFLILACSADRIYRIHTRWFPISRETFNTVIYSFLALYKLIIVAFNLVPYLVLLLVG